MNKKTIPLILIIIAILAVGVIAASAQAPSGSGWWVGFTIQNADPGNDITVASVAYPKMGATDTTEYNSSVVIPDGGAVTFHPGLAGTCASSPTVATNGCRIGFTGDSPAGLKAGFEGSVVISSGGPAVAVAQVNNNKTSGSAVGVTGGDARSGYQGTGGTIADTTLYFPGVKNNFVGQTTAFFVQAAGAEANVTIDYTMKNGGAFSENQVIDANKMYVFLPGSAGVPSCNGGNSDTCIGGAIVTSTSGPIAGTAVEYEEDASVAEFVLAARGLAPSDTGTTIIAPTMKNDFYGGTTGASVYNTHSTNTATVDLEFTITNVDTASCGVSIGQVLTDQITVGPQASEVVSVYRNNIGGIPNCAFFAMTASTINNGGENIAITVNEGRTSGGNTFKAVYTGFNAANATDIVFFPLDKENFFDNTTGLTLVNASPTFATTVDVTYAGSTGTHVLRTISLDPGEAVPLRQVFNGSSNFTVVSGGLPSAGNKYSVTATANTSGAVIVGLAQEAYVGSGTALDVYNVEGFNQ